MLFLVDFFNRLKAILPIKMNAKAASNPLTGYEGAQDGSGKLHTAAIDSRGVDVLSAALIPTLVFVG